MSQGRQGYLFFDAGSVAHATAGDHVGEDAALEMLGWENGSFVQSEVEWPSRVPISTPWQQLLMQAAHRSDESRRSTPELLTESSKRVVALPSLRSSSSPRPLVPQRVSVPLSAAPVPAFPVLAIPSPVLAVPSPVRESSPPAVQQSPSVAGAVRLGANGEVLAARAQGHRLVGLGAYVRRLCDLIGDDLGLGGVREFQGQLETRRISLFVEDAGSCVVVETTGADPLSSAEGIFDSAGRLHG